MMIKKNQINQFSLAVIMLLISALSFSQNFKEDKRIYLLDVTGSMWGAGGGQDIFLEVKNNLIKTINSLDNPETSITVITFGKDVKDKWDSKATAEGKEYLISKINTFKEYEGLDIQKATNICAVLEEANEEIESMMFNYIFLYTDGEHNFYKNKTNNSLQCIKNIVPVICSKNNRTDDVYPFYIMLTEKANSEELRNALECFKVVPCETPEIIIVRAEKNNYSINLLENDLSSEIAFVSNKNSSLHSEVNVIVRLENNNFFTLDKTEYILSPDLGAINLELTPLKSLDEIKKMLPTQSKLEVTFDIKYNAKASSCKLIEMRPNSIVIDVINKREKTVTITIINEDN